MSPYCHHIVIILSSLSLLSSLSSLSSYCHHFHHIVIIVIILSSHCHHCHHIFIPNSKNANNVVCSSQVGRTTAPLTRLFPCCSSSSVSGRNRRVVILIFNLMETRLLYLLRMSTVIPSVRHCKNV